MTLEKKILTVDELFQRIDRVSPADIQKTANEIFVNQKMNLALIGPFRDAQPFEKLLKI